MSALAPVPILDLPAIPPGDRLALVFATFRSLAASDAFELLSDHDPQPLHSQFEAEVPGQFTWATQENGPRSWRIRITRTAAGGHGNGRCCGSCGGL